MEILAAGGRGEFFRLEGCSRAATGRVAEHAAKQILEAAGSAAAAKSPARATGAALETVRAEAEAFETAGARVKSTAALPRAAAEIVTLETRFAFGVDLAAVEGLAFVFVAGNLIGGVQLGEARGGLGIVLVGVGMQLLGHAPIGALDLGLARTLGNPQNFVRGRAFVKTPVKSPARLVRPATRTLMWGSNCPDAISTDQERFQGLSVRTSQPPLSCLQASPCIQACDAPCT